MPGAHEPVHDPSFHCATPPRAALRLPTGLRCAPPDLPTTTARRLYMTVETHLSTATTCILVMAVCVCVHMFASQLPARAQSQ